MKKALSLIVLVGAFILGCNNTSENTMLLSGNINGLKKGTLYLEHLKDSTLVTIDSLEIKGNGNFSFQYELEGPELFYLYLKKADQNEFNDRLRFFGEKGNIVIHTAWNTFDSNAKISGSQSNEKFREYQDMVSKFNTRALGLAQIAYASEIQKNPKALDSLSSLVDKNILRKYRYLLNFALNNPDSHVAPYAVLSEIPDANPTYLDSIYKVLTPKVANAKYGKALKKHLESSRKQN